MIRHILATLGFVCVSLGVAAGYAADARADAQMDGDQKARRSEAEYVMPAVKLLRADGRTVALGNELNDGRPVVLNFIFTTCTTICPMSSQLFERFQHALGPKREKVHLVSISIDPEEDTPARLRAYAKKFHAERGWDYYTGTTAAIEAVERAFLSYGGDKMSHRPLTLVRAAPGRRWVRFDGFATADDLLAESKHWPAAPALALAGR